MSLNTFSLLVASTAMIWTLPAAAQSTSDTVRANEDGLDTIVVTAQRRETTLERTPMTINVVSGDQLRAQGVTEIADLSATVPGLTMNESPGGLPSVSVRGIGTAASNQPFEQSVGLFVDGVYHPRQRQYRDSLFDVERVEVVKGSQGVLFGKNTSIGAVSVITRRPGNELGGYLQVEHEFNFNSTNVEGAIDLPATDNLAFRVAANFNDVGGYVYNAAQNRHEMAGQRYVIRAVADWDITPDFNALLKLQWGRVDTLGNAFEFVTAPNPAGLIGVGVLDGGQEKFVKYEATGAAPDTADYQRNFDPSLVLRYNFGDGFNITSTTGYSRYTFRNGFDTDSSPLSFISSEFRERFYQFSQELRLASPGSGPVSFIVGGVYLKSRSAFDYITFYGGLPLFGGLYGTVSQSVQQDQETLAAFGNVDWRPTDRLTVSLGARYSSDTKDAVYNRRVIDDLGRPTNIVSLLVGPGSSHAERHTDNTFDFSGTLSYALSSTATLYASAGRGNKGAAFNNQAGLTVPYPVPFLVPRETATTYEVGIKGRFLDGRAYASLAGFILNVKDMQDSFYNPTIPGLSSSPSMPVRAGLRGKRRSALHRRLRCSGISLGYPPRVRPMVIACSARRALPILLACGVTPTSHRNSS